MRKTSTYFDEEGALLPQVKWETAQYELLQIADCINYVLDMWGHDGYSMMNKSKLNHAEKLIKHFLPSNE